MNPEPPLWLVIYSHAIVGLSLVPYLYLILLLCRKDRP